MNLSRFQNPANPSETLFCYGCGFEFHQGDLDELRLCGECRETEEDDMSQTKEQIYDEQISPLMRQIIEICKANHVAMFATFDIPNEQDAGLCCSTCLPDESGHIPERLAKGQAAANRRASVPPMPIKIITIDRDGKAVAQTVVLG